MQGTIGRVQLVDMIARDVLRNEQRYRRQDRAALRKAVGAVLWQAADLLASWGAEACSELDAVAAACPEIGDWFDLTLLSDQRASCDLVIAGGGGRFSASFGGGHPGFRGDAELGDMLADKVEARAEERGIGLSEASGEEILRDWLSTEAHLRFVGLFREDTVLEASAERERTSRVSRRSSAGLGYFLAAARLGIEPNPYNIRALSRITAPPRRAG